MDHFLCYINVCTAICVFVHARECLVEMVGSYDVLVLCSNWSTAVTTG